MTRLPMVPWQARRLAATLAWLGPTPATAADLIAAHPSPSHSRTRARQFLTTFLKGAPRTAAELRAAARSQNFNMRTLRRAAKDLNITFRQIGNHLIGQSVFWLLPGQRVPKSALDPNGLDQWLESLEHGINEVRVASYNAD